MLLHLLEAADIVNFSSTFHLGEILVETNVFFVLPIKNHSVPNFSVKIEKKKKPKSLKHYVLKENHVSVRLLKNIKIDYFVVCQKLGFDSSFACKIISVC